MDLKESLFESLIPSWASLLIALLLAQAVATTTGPIGVAIPVSSLPITKACGGTKMFFWVRRERSLSFCSKVSGVVQIFSMLGEKETEKEVFFCSSREGRMGMFSFLRSFSSL